MAGILDHIQCKLTDTKMFICCSKSLLNILRLFSHVMLVSLYFIGILCPDYLYLNIISSIFVNYHARLMFVFPQQMARVPWWLMHMND
jgi:hypothetical protein